MSAAMKFSSAISSTILELGPHSSGTALPLPQARGDPGDSHGVGSSYFLESPD